MPIDAEETPAIKYVVIPCVDSDECCTTYAAVKADAFEQWEAGTLDHADGINDLFAFALSNHVSVFDNWPDAFEFVNSQGGVVADVIPGLAY